MIVRRSSTHCAVSLRIPPISSTAPTGSQLTSRAAVSSRSQGPEPITHARTSVVRESPIMTAATAIVAV